MSRTIRRAYTGAKAVDKQCRCNGVHIAGIIERIRIERELIYSYGYISK